MSLEEEVLRGIRPTAETVRQVQEAVGLLEGRVREVMATKGLPLQLMLVGSVAKGTYVGTPDIDLFILFPEEVERPVLERVGLEIGQEVLGGELRYAEHPYTHGKFMGLEVDLVPCYAVTDPGSLRSAVDRTPFHTRYVLANLGEGQRDQVLLLKRFMKGVGTYGAEARVQGFSGYLNELLVIKYGTFRGVLEAAIDWRPGLVLDVLGGRKGGEAPLTFIDPVDPRRNVASALSLDNLCLFQQACREYLGKEDERFFFPSPRPLLGLREIKDRLRQRGNDVLVVEMDRPGLIDDNLYPQVQRSILGLRKLLEASDFKVLDAVFDVDEKVRMAFEMEHCRLPLGRLHLGPPAWTPNAGEFVSKWRENGLGQPFLREGRWQAHVRRDHHRAEDLLMARGREASLGNEFRELRGMHCTVGSAALVSHNRGVLTKLLDKRERWRV